MAPKDASVGLNERRAAVTREAICQAVTDLLAHTHPASISVPAVAQEAGVSVRTVYRYFPNKQAMLDAVANMSIERIAEKSQSADALFEDPATWLPWMWRQFGEDVNGIRAQHQSPAGLDLRDRRLAGSRAGVQAQISQQHPGASADDQAVLSDAIIAVTSSSMFLELHDRMGWTPGESAEIALWIVEAMQERFERTGWPLGGRPARGTKGD